MFYARDAPYGDIKENFGSRHLRHLSSGFRHRSRLWLRSQEGKLKALIGDQARERDRKRRGKRHQASLVDFVLDFAFDFVPVLGNQSKRDDQQAPKFGSGQGPQYTTI